MTKTGNTRQNAEEIEHGDARDQAWFNRGANTGFLFGIGATLIVAAILAPLARLIWASLKPWLCK